MGDTSGCQISSTNLAVYLQGVSVTPSSNLTSQYFVTASLPSSASTKRVWQFTTQGTITGPDTATLTLDYTQAHENCPLYNITFEGALNGTLTVHTQVFSANKFISYQLTSTYVLVLTLKIPKSIQECFGPATTQNYSFDVFVNDATYTNCTTYNSEGYTFLPLLNEKEGSVILTNNSRDTVTIDYLCVGGGGGGGGAEGIYAGGGGGGFVSIGTFTVDSSGSVQCNYSVGAGGSGGSGGSSGNTGSSGSTTTLLVIDGTSVLLDVSGSGGGGGEGAGPGGNGGDSGFSDSSGNISYSGGEGCSSSTTFIGGGGAGASKDGSPSNSNCNSVGNGGNGYQWIDGNYYGGGGGGTGTQSYSGTGGQGGGANGNTGNSGTSSTGGGGGGGISDGLNPDGGNGGSGICVLAWSTTTSISFTNCS